MNTNLAELDDELDSPLFNPESWHPSRFSLICDLMSDKFNRLFHLHGGEYTMLPVLGQIPPVRRRQGQRALERSGPEI